VPLAEYSEKTVAALRRGDDFILEGMSKIMFEKYESGKDGFTMDMHKRVQGMRKQN